MINCYFLKIQTVTVYLVNSPASHEKQKVSHCLMYKFEHVFGALCLLYIYIYDSENVILTVKCRSLQTSSSKINGWSVRHKLGVDVLSLRHTVEGDP